jgi:hypothetical protein
MMRRLHALLIVLLMAVCTFSLGYAQKSRSASLVADDYIAIEQLYSRYYHAIDSREGNGEVFAATFTGDGVFAFGRDTASGHDALVAFARRVQNGARQLRHYGSNVIVKSTANGVRGSCYAMVFDVTGTQGVITTTGYYDDTLEKTADGWRFKKRIFYRDGPESASPNR